MHLPTTLSVKKMEPFNQGTQPKETISIHSQNRSDNCLNVLILTNLAFIDEDHVCLNIDELKNNFNE